MLHDDVLDALEVHLEPFALCEIRGDGSLGLGRRTHAVLHYVLAGQGSVTVDGRPAITARAGSVILIPAFAAHSIHASGGDPGAVPDCRPIEAGLQHLVAGTGPTALAAVCGRIAVAYRGMKGTIDLLRAPLVEHLAPDDRVRGALDDFVAELASPTVGSRALARSLLLQCVIILLRRRLNQGDPSMHWMRGLGDETLWPPLQSMLDNPERGHTVDSLAALAGLSRSIFAERFHAAYGSGPIDVLRSIRLRRAAELLSRSDLPVRRVASLVGYRSRSYFSRAFLDAHGVSPDAFRRSLVGVVQS